MVAIRLQRTGRKGHAMYRMVAQDARLTPTSGKVVAYLGHYDPHMKTVVIDKEKVAFYLDHGAQPSPRVVRLLKQEGVKLPEWVREPAQKQAAVRNPEKLRKNRSQDIESIEVPQDAEPIEVPQDTEPVLPPQSPSKSTETPPKEEATSGQSAEEATDQPAEGASEPEPAAEAGPTEETATESGSANAKKPQEDTPQPKEEDTIPTENVKESA